MSKKTTILIDMGKYRHVTLPVDEARELLNIIAEKLGKRTNDIDEAQRYIANFDVFYEMTKKKFKDSLAPPKSVDDMIRGNIVVDRVILAKEGDKRIVTIVFDRRVPLDSIEEALKDLGYEVEINRKSMY